AGGTVRARVKQTSGTTASQPLFPRGTEVVLRVRKVTSSPLITEVAISIVSATINGQSVPVNGRELFRRFRSGGPPEEIPARRRTGASGPRAIPAGTDLYLTTTRPALR